MQWAFFCITLAEPLAIGTGPITMLYDRAVTPMYTTYNAHNRKFGWKRQNRSTQAIKTEIQET
jgi:hypothetical protein